MKEKIGLTELYNRIDDGAYTVLSELHRRLDHAVLDAYGFDRTLAGNPLDLKVALAARHAAIVAGETQYNPFHSLRGDATPTTG